MQLSTFWARSPERSMIWHNHTQTPYMRVPACGTKHSGFQCRTDLRQPCRCTTVTGSRTRTLYPLLCRARYGAVLGVLIISLPHTRAHTHCYPLTQTDTDTQTHTRTHNTHLLPPGDAGRNDNSLGRIRLSHAQKTAHPPIISTRSSVEGALSCRDCWPAAFPSKIYSSFRPA